MDIEVCEQCERIICNSCKDYSNYKYNYNLGQNTQNSNNIINSACTESHNPPVAMVSEVDISLQTGVSWEFENVSKGVGNVNEDKLTEYDIENFLEYSYDDPEYLQICNGLISPSDIIDWEAILRYMRDRNKGYCEWENLCPTCHSPLKEYEQMEDYCGSNMVVGSSWECPNNC